MNLDDIAFLLKGCSGKIYNRVYYQWKGTTRHKKAPGSYNKIPTPSQAIARNNLLDANAYAKNAMLDPRLKAFYLSIAILPQNAFNAAVSDFLQKKKVMSSSAGPTAFCTSCVWTGIK